MLSNSPLNHQIHNVFNFQDLMSMSFVDQINVICWARTLKGDFNEIVSKINASDHIVEIDQGMLLELELSEQGQLARNFIIQDMKALESQGASPALNLIEYYDRDETFPLFPTDVYSFHVDRAPIAADTILCTYYGAPSEILSNTQCTPKVLIPEIRAELKKMCVDDDFEQFLSENFFDLHYQAHSDAVPIPLRLGHICRLAIDHPESKVLPCVHRAPKENEGQKRLLLIC